MRELTADGKSETGHKRGSLGTKQKTTKVDPKTPLSVKDKEVLEHLIEDWNDAVDSRRKFITASPKVREQFLDKIRRDLSPGLLDMLARRGRNGRDVMVEEIRKAIVIAEWRRSQTERIRVTLERFRGRNVVTLRTWWTDKDGKDQPGRDGITLDVAHVPKLARAFKRARKQAKKAVLIDES